MNHKSLLRSIFNIFTLLAVLASLLVGALNVTPAYALGITVNTTNDENNKGVGCSLREAITAANTDAAYGGCSAGSGADTITLPAGTYTLTLPGAGEDANATGDLDITGDLTITGAGAGTTIVQAGATPGTGIDRVFEIIGSGVTVLFSDVTIANGTCASCQGGGIDIKLLSTVTVANSIISGNSATFGGGISCYGGLTVTDSTFSGNTAIQGGGGILFNTGGGAIGTISNSTFDANSATSGGGINNFSGTLTVTNSTFSGNLGGGIYNNSSATLTVINSTVSGNTGYGINNQSVLHLKNTLLANSVTGTDCYNFGGDTIATNTNNLIETNGPSGNMCGTPAVSADPILGALANNGGPTQTFALLTGSPAIDAGDNTTCSAAPVNNKDQRGVTRPFGAQCDIGSYEMNNGKLITRSVGTDDGYILESGETTNAGGSMNSTATALRLGDDATKRQYRSLLSFNTASLPNTAVITKVTLKVKRQGVTGGGDPVATFQGFMLDIRKGTFGTLALQIADFQTAAQKTVGPLSPALVSGWYKFNLTGSKAYINKLASGSGVTQIRLRFALDDNNDFVANYLSLYSGNYTSNTSRPLLVIEYYVP